VEQDRTASGELQNPIDMQSGVLRDRLTAHRLSELNWKADLIDLDQCPEPHRLSLHFRKRAEEHGTKGAYDLAGICQLISIAVSMTCGTRSRHVQQLNHHDVSALQLLADRVEHLWLKARLADLACTVGPDMRIRTEQEGALAARSYLELSFAQGDQNSRDQGAFLQRAMVLGRLYLKRDQEFHDRLWARAMCVLVQGIENGEVGVAFLLASEFKRRTGERLAEIATLFERQADQWSANSPTLASQQTYAEAAKLWLAAENRTRAKENWHKSAGVFIALSRTQAQATLQSMWMLEGIAILRRNQGDRNYIKELQNELAGIRGRIPGEMHTITHPIDVADIVDHVTSRITADTFFDALLQVAFAFSTWKSAEEARQAVQEGDRKYPFRGLFTRTFLDDDGVPITNFDPLDPHNEEQLEQQMVRDLAEIDHLLLARAAIPRAISLLNEKFQPTLGDVFAILRNSPCVPHGHEWSLARGLQAGINEDWREAAVFLIPQAEPFIRAAFKRHGLHTLSATQDGAEEEKSLSELLSHPEVYGVLHPDVVLELKALLTHKAGHNLRNRYGHGLINDDLLANTGTVVLWWTMLRLILWPWRERLLALRHENASPSPS